MGRTFSTLTAAAIILTPFPHGGNDVSAAERVTPTWTVNLYSQDTATPAPNLDTTTASAPSSKKYFTVDLFGKLVEVPVLRGKTWYEASTLLAENNLVGVKLNSAARKDDEVRNQDVAPGKKVFPGTPVKLDLVAKVPNVVGKTLGEAYEILEVENGFIAKYDRSWSSEMEVTVQKPEAGALHRRGRDVDIAPMVEVPNVVRMSIYDAKNALTEAHLYADIPDYFEDTDVVLRQSQRAGKMVTALSKVRLTPGTRVPDLIGMNRVGADRALRAAGINGDPVFKAVYTYNSWMHGRTVVNRQSIRAGNYVPRESRMRVTLLRYVYRQPVIVVPPRNGGGVGNGGGNGSGNNGGRGTGGGGGG